MARITLTTVLYNSSADLPSYASAVRPAIAAGAADLILVDNNSPDDSAQSALSLLPEAELLRSPINLGFAGACNLAWSRVKTDYWLLLNPDVEAGPEPIMTLVDWMDEHPTVALCSPLLSHVDGEPWTVARPHDSLWRPILETTRLHKLLPQSVRSTLLLPGHRETPAIIKGWIPGAALVVRSGAVESAGLMDGTLFMYGEDREWCWRFSRSGWDIGVCSRVTLTHRGNTSAISTWSRRERYRQEVEGHLRATRLMRGRVFTWSFALVFGISLLLASLDRRQDIPNRSLQRCRGSLYIYASFRCGGR